ncbi:ankyrin repeat-containing domain protein [Aspergillus heterothallicus]
MHEILDGLASEVETLLASANLNMDAADRKGRDLLSIAMIAGNVAIVEHLQDSLRPRGNIPDFERRTTLMWAVMGDFYAGVHMLPRYNDTELTSDHNRDTPLDVAVRLGHLETAQVLVSTVLAREITFDINTMNTSGETPCCIASANGDAESVSCQLFLFLAQIRSDSGPNLGIVICA